MKIYTKRGDCGETDLYYLNKELVCMSKSDSIFHLLGKIDELNVEIIPIVDSDSEFHIELQHLLIYVSGDIQAGYENPTINLEECTKNIELRIDDLTGTLPPLNNFIIPNHYHSHRCRVICREVERLCVAEKVHPSIIQFFNRLSDYFFTLSRVLQKEEIVYDKNFLID